MGRKKACHSQALQRLRKDELQQEEKWSQKEGGEVRSDGEVTKRLHMLAIFNNLQ